VLPVLVVDAEAARRVTPRTKAVLAVHLFGRPAPVEDLRHLGLPIVASHPDSDTAQTIVAIAEAIDARREAGTIVKSLPLVG